MASSDAQNAFSTGIGANPHGGDSGPGDIPWPLWAKAAARSAWLTAEFKRLNHLGYEVAATAQRNGRNRVESRHRKLDRR